jgi:hypothetical protein
MNMALMMRANGIMGAGGRTKGGTKFSRLRVSESRWGSDAERAAMDETRPYQLLLNF